MYNTEYRVWSLLKSGETVYGAWIVEDYKTMLLWVNLSKRNKDVKGSGLEQRTISV